MPLVFAIAAILCFPLFVYIYFALITMPVQLLLASLAVGLGATKMRSLPAGPKRTRAKVAMIIGIVVLAIDSLLIVASQLMR